MRLQALGSGSNGNCFVLQTAAGTLLIDAGISRSRIVAGLKSLGIPKTDVLGVLVTHAHSDHILGLAVLHSYLDFRVIATPQTVTEIREKQYRDIRYGLVADRAIAVPLGAKLELGGYTITTLPAVHDIAGSCGFHIKFGKLSLSYTTDTGKVVDEFQELMRTSEYIVMESNHDKKMLEDSRRPLWLKRRIRATHLSNDETLEILQNVVTSRTRMVALAHLSGACNTPEEVMRQIHRYHLDSEAPWDWVVCTRHEKSSLITQLRSSLLLEGGLNNRTLPEFDLNPAKTGLDRYFG